MDKSSWKDLDHPVGPVQTSGMPPGGDDGPSSSNNKDNEDNKSTAGGMTEMGESVRNEALGNYVILRHVFQSLENNDLGSCCQVNKFWRSIAHPLYVRHFEVKLERMEDDEDDEENFSGITFSYLFKITGHAMYDAKKVTYSEESLKGASKFLLEAAKASKIAISFRSFWRMDGPMLEIIESLLSKTGKYVTGLLSGGGKIYLSACCKWLGLTPNLIHLEWDASYFIDDYLDPKDARIPMVWDRIIQVADLGERKYATMVRILKMAPNLEEIWSFPVLLWRILVETGKALSVKSITFQNWEVYEEKIAFENMSYLGLKLKEFNLTSSTLCDPEYQPSVRRMLESSRDSLEILSISPRTESFDFQALPPMNALKEIWFQALFTSKDENVRLKFLVPHIEFQRIFPNVSVLNFSRFQPYPDPPVNASVNEEQLATWGQQIQHLKLVDVSAEILRSTSRLFPSVHHLEFKVLDCNELGIMLREFGGYWPDMESLVVEVDMYRADSESDLDSDCTFDSALTGIPDVTLNRLRDPRLREDHFSLEEIEKFKEGSVLRKLSKLKILKFSFQNYPTENYRIMMRSRDLLGKLCAITAVSKEFGFQFLPDLKIVLQTSEKLFQEVSEGLKASRLGTLVSYEVEYAEPQ